MVSHASRMPLAFLPSPPVNGFHVGPLFVHFYGLMYVVGIALAIYITRRRWAAAGGDPLLVADVATWAVPAGIIGGRIYFDITTPADIPPHWWGVLAVWSGGLGIWGGIALGAAAGIWRVRRAGASARMFADAVAPALLVAQAVGRVGNYFNQELFGRPSGLPWALQISPAHRPAGYGASATFQPTFLYELLFDLLWAAALVWLGHHRKIRAPGLFALYVAGYSAFRIFEESLRIDSSEHFLGLRLNFYVASAGVIAGLAWYVLSQRRAPSDSGGGDDGGTGEPSEVGDAGDVGKVSEVSEASADGSAGDAGDAGGSAGDAGGSPAGAGRSGQPADHDSAGGHDSAGSRDSAGSAGVADASGSGEGSGSAGGSGSADDTRSVSDAGPASTAARPASSGA